MPSNDDPTLTLSSNMATRIFQTILSLRSRCCTTGVMFLPCPLRLPYVPRRIYLSHFARILNGRHWNVWEVITTTNVLNNYMLGKTGTWTRKQDRTENLNRCSVSLAVMSNMCWHLVNEFSFHARDESKCDCRHVNLKISLSNFK